MTQEEIRKLSCSDLDHAAELGLRKLGRNPAKIFSASLYSSNMGDAWMLWQAALASGLFFDFCEWLKRLGETEDWVVALGFLSPRQITEAFVLAVQDDLEI